MSDVRNGSSGDLAYMGPAVWGLGVFEKQGNLALQERTVQGRATGHVPIPFRLTAPGKVSIAIHDAAGKLVRTALGGKPYPAGAHTFLWDGLDDFDRPLPAGSYSASLLTHDGITPRYVCDIGVSGTPPYQTEDGTGGWAGDYRRPQVMAALDDTLVLGTANAEAAPGAILADLDGRKRAPVAAIGHAVALHKPDPAGKGFGYMLSSAGAKIAKFSLDHGRLEPFTTGRPETQATTRKPDEKNDAWGARAGSCLAVAVVGDRLVVSSRADDKLLLLDLASGEPRGEASLKSPFGLAAAADGGLYAVSGNAVGRYDLAAGTFTPLRADLDEPQHLACDAEGNVYVSLQGKTMQVWKLSPTGQVLATFGVAGGRPSLGAFTPTGMLNPYGIAVDRAGRLWVAEADDLPKRYSAWNADGTLFKQFFGSVPYSTRACPDYAKPEHVYVEGVRYVVDYAAGTWSPDATVLRTSTDGPYTFEGSSWVSGLNGNHNGGTYATVGGRKFFLRRGTNSILYEAVGDRYVPRMKLLGKGLPDTPLAGKNRIWLDANNDGRVQDAEIVEGMLKSTYNGMPMDGSLNLYWCEGRSWAAQGGAKARPPYRVMRWKFLGFGPNGELKYADPMAAEVVAEDPEGGMFADLLVDEAGSAYVLVSSGSLGRGERAHGSGHRIVKFAADGTKQWEYHNVECAFAWTAPNYTPGYVVSAMVFSEQRHPDLLAVTGYYGQYFLLDKKTGLFVDALGEDQRSAYTLGPHMVLTESFNGALFRHDASGKTYFIGGDADERVWDLEGLGSIQRQTIPLTVSADMRAKAEAAARQNLLAAQSAAGKKTATIKRLSSARIDGRDDEWVNVPPLTICLEGSRTAQAQWGYDDDNLYVRFQVGDESPFVNTPTDQRLLFKTGDSVEVNLATDTSPRPVRGQNQQAMRPGDMRIIMARTPDEKLVATRYRYATTDKEKPNAFTVETMSSGKDTLDDVVPWNDLPMRATCAADGYVVEAAIPWSAIGVEPRSGLLLSGDVGVIYGNEGGTKNAIRYQWSDKSPEVSINNDIPSEIRIHPNDWAALVLE